MTLLRVAVWLFMALSVSTSAAAHGGEKHGSAGIEGIVREAARESFTVDAKEGAVVAHFTPETRIVSEDGAALGRDALKPGTHVGIAGHKLPGGGIVAVEVVVHGRPVGHHASPPGTPR